MKEIGDFIFQTCLFAALEVENINFEILFHPLLNIIISASLFSIFEQNIVMIFDNLR